MIAQRREKEKKNLRPKDRACLDHCMRNPFSVIIGIDESLVPPHRRQERDGRIHPPARKRPGATRHCDGGYVVPPVLPICSLAASPRAGARRHQYHPCQLLEWLRI